ncbi:MAG TPA: tetratricopeptide repeat protein [Ardenticatenaceae bacterium]
MTQVTIGEFPAGKVGESFDDHCAGWYNPAMNEHETALLARQHFDRAYEHQQAGRIGDAIQEYRHSIALSPTAEAYTFLGWVLGTMGRYDEAIEHCHTAISLDPDFGNPYNDIGAYLIEMERWQEAQPWFELALNAPRYETRPHAHFNLGRVYEYFGNYAKALFSYAAALDENSAYEAAEWARLALLARMN